MNALINARLKRKIDNYKRKGGKKSRANQTRKMLHFIDYFNVDPYCISKRQVHDFYREKQLSASSERDYHYALCQLWRLCEKTGEPPRPPSMR